MKKKLVKLLIGLGFTFALAVIFAIFSESKTYQMLELKALDLRFSLRGSRPIQAPILHIDIDDQSLDKLGRWPWPRSYHAKLIDTLWECGAKQVLMDILFTEKLKDKPEDDVLFAGSIAHSGIVYLPFYFAEGQVERPSAELEALLLKDITISVEDAAGILKAETGKLRDKMHLAKRYIMDEAIRDFVRSEPDICEDDLLRKIEDAKGWFLFPAEESYIRENFQNQKLARFFNLRELIFAWQITIRLYN